MQDSSDLQPLTTSTDHPDKVHGAKADAPGLNWLSTVRRHERDSTCGRSIFDDVVLPETITDW